VNGNNRRNPVMMRNELPMPPHYKPESIGEVWRVSYQQLAAEAGHWSRRHRIRSAGEDQFTIFLLLVDLQNTFCNPEFELYVGGRSGTGAVDDSRRLCEFIYRNLDILTRIGLTMDTHQAMQIFHPVFLVDARGNHPPPFTIVSREDVEKGRWKINPDVAVSLKLNESLADEFLLYYTRKLEEGRKYALTVWPYHAMLGGIGHALVSAVEEAVFFHAIARTSAPDFQMKGSHSLTENYSVIRPEVLDGPQHIRIAEKNPALVEAILEYDAVLVAGQAKSHCVAWTMDSVLEEISAIDGKLAQKVYLLEDCTSSVVIPGVADYTDHAKRTFERFADAGMHLVKSTDPLHIWPGIRL
jgi:nicotinamidase-related amidase